jgi:hypothetical protein
MSLGPLMARARRTGEQLTKLLRNFPVESAGVLGGRGYVRLLCSLAGALPTVLRDGTLTEVDRRMGSRPWRVRFKGSAFVVDCPFFDARTAAFDPSYSFGLIRELFIRNCYLRDLPRGIEACDVVVDCGANRGLFSLYAATRAQRVIAVEAQPAFADMIRASMAFNGLTNYEVDEVFVGGGGALANHAGLATTHTDIDALMGRHEIKAIDFLKLDIEGSEYELFRDAAWLKSVKRLSMEVHCQFGSPDTIVSALRAHGFMVQLRDADLRQVDSPASASFIYAAVR